MTPELQLSFLFVCFCVQTLHRDLKPDFTFANYLTFEDLVQWGKG